MRHYIYYFLLLLIVGACRQAGGERHQSGLRAPVFPDYSDCVIPVNIAPLNFEMMKRCDEVDVVFRVDGKTVFSCRGNQYVDIPLRKWKTLLKKAVTGSGEVVMTVAARNGEKWEEFLPQSFRVATEPIDEWIAYRLIYPGYVGWAHMGLFQRRLTDFQEKAILDNRMTGNNCMNCHNFHANSPEHFIFHMRGKNSGTVLVENGQCSLVSGKMNGKPLPLVYPAWHPSGKFIAFSSNSTMQFFHAATEKLVEVYDERSDIVLFDVEKKEVVTDSCLLAQSDLFETYPAWSPEGDRLYFCSTDSVPMPEKFKNIQYQICSVKFDTVRRKFIGPVDTVLSIPGKSVVFPRISPNGKYLLVNTLDYGCFPIWHKESDLMVWDLTTRQPIPHDANSFDAESYHVWSSNGRWVMFTSRRTDGLFTRLWFSYVDNNGHLGKPFPLPQREELLRDTRLKSYNVPEFIKGEVTVSPRKLLQTVR